MSLTLHELRDRLTSFNIGEEIVNTILSTDKDVAKLIRIQMAFGLKGTGRIKNVYTKRYDYSVLWGDYRKSLNLQIDHFDFKVTGEFWGSIGVFKVTQNGFEIYARSVKTTNLVKLFTEDIFKMNDESLAEYTQLYFFPELQRRIESKLGLKFGV